MIEHPDLGPLLVPDGGPGGEQRAGLLRHLHGCAECRTRLRARDPIRLFALLALDAPPREALDRLSRNVRREVARLEPPAAPGRRFRHVPLAASLLLAGTLGLYVSLRPTGEPLLDTAPPAVRQVEALFEPAAPVAGIELISSPGSADVVAFSVGETQVLMIFDEELDL